MKKELSPGMIAAVIACVVVIAGFLLWKNGSAKPEYPGADAPTAEATAGTEKKPGERTTPDGSKHITEEQAKKMNIPGVGHN